MKKKILVSIPELENITIELNDTNSPKTCKSILDSLPFSVNAHVWGEEIYTDESPISQSEENAKSLVDLKLIGQVEKRYAYFLVLHQLVKKGRLNHIRLLIS